MPLIATDLYICCSKLLRCSVVSSPCYWLLLLSLHRCFDALISGALHAHSSAALCAPLGHSLGDSAGTPPLHVYVTKSSRCSAACALAAKAPGGRAAMTPKGRTLSTALFTRLERSEPRAQGTVRVAPWYWQGGCTAWSCHLPCVRQRVWKPHVLDLVFLKHVLEDQH